MDAAPATFQALLIVVLVVVPGFVFSQFTRRSLGPTIQDKVDWRYVISIIARGILLHLTFPGSYLWTLDIARQYRSYRSEDLLDNLLPTGVWAIIVLYLWPTVTAMIISRVVIWHWVDGLLSFFGMHYVGRIPSAFDYAMLRGGAWVKIYLNDDSRTVIAGEFGKDSAYDTDGRSQDIFIEKVYNLKDDGNFGPEVTDTDGMWIALNRVSRIEFLRNKGDNVAGEGESNECQVPPTSSRRDALRQRLEHVLLNQKQMLGRCLAQIQRLFHKVLPPKPGNSPDSKPKDKSDQQ